MAAQIFQHWRTIAKVSSIKPEVIALTELYKMVIDGFDWIGSV